MKQQTKFPILHYLIIPGKRYHLILAYGHYGGKKLLNIYMSKCHTSSAHQTETQYCTSDTDGRHVYTITQPIKM